MGLQDFYPNLEIFFTSIYFQIQLLTFPQRFALYQSSRSRKYRYKRRCYLIENIEFGCDFLQTKAELYQLAFSLSAAKMSVNQSINRIKSSKTRSISSLVSHINL